MERFEQVVTGTKTVAITAGSGTFLFGLSVNEWAAIVGATVAVLSFVMQWWYNRKRLLLQMEQMRATFPFDDEDHRPG